MRLALPRPGELSQSAITNGKPSRPLSGMDVCHMGGRGNVVSVAWPCLRLNLHKSQMPAKMFSWSNNQFPLASAPRHHRDNPRHHYCLVSAGQILPT